MRRDCADRTEDCANRTVWTELSGLCRNEGGTAFCVSAEGKGLSSADCAELLLKIED